MNHSPLELRLVLLRAPRQHAPTVLRLLEAEPRLSGCIEGDSGGEAPWGLLVVGDEPPRDDDEDRYPQIAVRADPGAAHDGSDPPSTPTEADLIADLAVTRLMEVSRAVLLADALVRAGGWRPAEVPPSLHASTVGVCGEGTELEATRRRLHALECTVLAIKPDEQTPGFVSALDAVVVLPSGSAAWLECDERLRGALVHERTIVVEALAESFNAGRSSATLTVQGAVRRAIAVLSRAAARADASATSFL